jgi:DNA-binding beta-propeller fold protein YncE
MRLALAGALPLSLAFAGTTQAASPATSAPSLPRVIGSFKAPDVNQGLQTDPRRGEVYIGRDDTSIISVVDEQSLRVTGTFNGGACCGQYNFSVNPANGDVYVAGVDDNTYIVNGTTHRVTNSGFESSGAYFDPANDTAYLPDLYRYKVALLQHGALKPTAYRHIGLDPEAAVDQIAFNPVTNAVYMVYLDIHGSGVVVLDGKSNRAIAFLPVAGPVGIAVNSRTNRIYVSGGQSGSTVTVFDAKTYRAVAHLAFGGDFIGSMVVNPLTNSVFALDFGNANVEPPTPSKVVVINGQTNKLSESIPMPHDITGAIAVDAVTGKVFVANDGLVTVIK